MTDEEKAPYVKLAEEDKIRYSREMTTYDGPLHIPVVSKRGHQNKVPVFALGHYSQIGCSETRHVSFSLLFERETRPDPNRKSLLEDHRSICEARRNLARYDRRGKGAVYAKESRGPRSLSRSAGRI